jgi:pteridine reductase
VAYLAKAEDVTGQIIFADGGAHLKSFDRDFMFL